MGLQHSRAHISRYWADTRTHTARPTAFTTGCAWAWHIVSFARNKGERFFGVQQRLRHAQGVNTPLPRHSISKGAHSWYTGYDMGCGGLGESARTRLRTGFTWSDVWTTLGRLNFLSIQRATRLRRGPHEVLSAFGSASPARSLGGSNVTQTNFEARPWLVDFHVGVALGGFFLFCVLGWVWVGSCVSILFSLVLPTPPLGAGPWSG